MRHEPAGPAADGPTSHDSIERAGVAEPPSRADADLADILARLDAEPDESGSTARVPMVSTGAPEVGGRLTDPRDLERPSTASDIVVESTGGLSFDPTFASYAQRAVAILVDTVVLGVALVPGIVVVGLGGPLVVVGLLLMVAAFAAVTFLASRSIAATGQWIGNRVAKTRIVDGINGSTIDTGRAAFRFLARHLVSPVFLFGFIVAFTDSQRRTFHDRLAGSVVVGRTREVWTADS